MASGFSFVVQLCIVSFKVLTIAYLEIEDRTCFFLLILYLVCVRYFMLTKSFMVVILGG